MANGQLPPRRVADPNNQTNGRWCKADPTEEQPGGTCGNRPVLGTTICHKHGAAAGQIKRAAKLRLVKESALQEAHRRMEGRAGTDQDALDHLLDSLYIAAQLVRVYADLTANLDEKEQLTVDSKIAGDQLHPFAKELRAWNAERSRIAKTCLDAGVEERRVRLAERMVDEFMRIQERSWDRLGLTADQKQLERRHIAKDLMRDAG